MVEDTSSCNNDKICLSKTEEILSQMKKEVSDHSKILVKELKPSSTSTNG